jgi:hypothetical protein
VEHAKTSKGGFSMSNIFIRKWFVFLLMTPLVFGLCFLGCGNDDDDDDNDDSQPPQAEITIRSDPDPVPFSETDSDGYNRWYFSLYVEERGGVGATCLAWEYDMYQNDGTLTGSASISMEDFINWLDDCDEHTEYIPPNSTICSTSFNARSSSNTEGWYIIMKMHFRDDNGYDFWVEGRVTLLPVP